MSNICMIIFPYGGYQAGSPRQENFWKIVNLCEEVVPEHTPFVVISKDTINKGKADAFFSDNNENSQYRQGKDSLDYVTDWSVDTCQRWLTGWGYVMDKIEEGYYQESPPDRIVQLAGDIDNIANQETFFSNLATLIAITDPWDFVIGDFTTGQRFSAKDLIDLYGTYPLLGNWFPEVSEHIHRLPLQKPRSEIFNIKISVLKELLEYRPFAYEQTLNMLIHSWDFEHFQWKYKIHTIALGIVQDDPQFRQFRGCLDQIERTERMLKIIWREINEPPKPKNINDKDSKQEYKQFMAEYDVLDRNSDAIRGTSRITIKALLSLYNP
ncbi:MAG: hypothetical protein AB4372_18260 [Xenococcus sp. (in: cyanobacteria)]